MKTEAYYNAREVDIPGLTLCYCGVESCERSFSMPPHTRDVYLLHYLFDGRCSFTTAGVTHHLSPGQVFAIFPGHVASYRADPDDPCSFCWVGFSGEHAAQILRLVGFDEANLVGRVPAEYAILDEITLCAKLINAAGPGLALALQVRLYTILSLLEQAHLSAQTKQPQRKTPVNEHVAKAKTYIMFQYMNDITIVDIAAHIGLERTYFSKIFKGATGESPQYYLLRYRLSRACELLEATAHSCKEISGFVGFSDEHYFSRVFKKIQGVSPRAYRQQYGSGAVLPGVQ